MSKFQSNGTLLPRLGEEIVVCVVGSLEPLQQIVFILNSLFSMGDSSLGFTIAGRDILALQQCRLRLACAEQNQRESFVYACNKKRNENSTVNNKYANKKNFFLRLMVP